MSSRARWVSGLLFFAATSGPGVTAAGAEEAGIGARYEFVLNLYAEGRRAEAVAALAEFTDGCDNTSALDAAHLKAVAERTSAPVHLVTVRDTLPRPGTLLPWECR